MADDLHTIDTDDVKRAYARWAPVYDLTFGKIADAGRREAVRHINTKRGAVLEVGVGTGISLSEYKPHLDVAAIDLSPEMLKLARRRVAREGLSHVTEIAEMDAGAMRFEDNSFDIVVAMYVMTVVPDPVAVMAELARVCKPGGEVIVVNHFSQKHGVRGKVEKAMGRFGDKLGWRPEFPIETILVRDDLKMLHSQMLKPLGLFTLIRFEKLAESAVDEKDGGQAEHQPTRQSVA